MANYTKSTLINKYSEVSDYSDRLFDRAAEIELTTPTAYESQQISCALVATTLLTTSKFSVLKSVALWNRDTANFATVTYKTGAGGATTQTIKLPASEFIRLTDVSTGTNISGTADTGAVTIEVFAVGT